MEETTRFNKIETDIALMQKDISNIERSIARMDTAIEQMVWISKTLAIQEKTLEMQERKIEQLDAKVEKEIEDEARFRLELDKRLDDRHKELMDKMDTMSDALTQKMEAQDARISTLENWKWYVIGAVAIVVFLLAQIDLPISLLIDNQ